MKMEPFSFEIRLNFDCKLDTFIINYLRKKIKIYAIF